MKSNEEMASEIYNQFNDDIGEALKNISKAYKANEALVSDPEFGIDTPVLVQILASHICSGIFVAYGESELAKEVLQTIMAESWKDICSKKDEIEEAKRRILNGKR